MKQAPMLVNDHQGKPAQNKNGISVNPRVAINGCLVTMGSFLLSLPPHWLLDTAPTKAILICNYYR